jgi:hypothetical protein
MSRASFGSISDDRSYNPKEISNCMGGSEGKWKEFIRKHVKHIEPFEGHLVVSGRLFNLAIEELSQRDTVEAKEARRRKAGVDKRQAKEATQ